MWSDPEEPDENLTDDWDTRVQDGGRLSVQNTQALDRLYDPKQAQSQFTGEALLDSQTKRLRPKQAMDYWATKKVEQKLKQPEIDVVVADPVPQAADAQSKPQALEGALALIRERELVGTKNFWRMLEESNAKQRKSLEEARRSNREHQAAISAGDKRSKKPWISWKEAAGYYMERGGTEKVASVSERQQQLGAEKRTALEQVFYAKFQGAIGGKALLEAMRTHPKQAEALKESEGKRGWVSARDIEAFYSTQEVAQLYRDAPGLSKSRVKVPKAGDLKPMRRMQADSISLKGLPSGRYTGVVNLIDVFTQFSWQVPVQTVGNASEAAAAINLAMKHIKDKYELPSEIELQTDNGPEFLKAFANALTDKQITVTHGPAFTSTAQSDVELSNRIWRGAMRRVLHTRDVEKKSWGKLMTLVNEIVNARPNSKLGGRSPAEVLKKSLSGDAELIESVSESILKSANAKRGPSRITPLSVGDRVRVIDEKYLASKLRSNDMKMQARWSKSIYTVRTVKKADSDTGFMPEYIVTTGSAATDAKDKTLKPPAGQKYRFFRHELLQKIEGTVEQARGTAGHSVDTDAQPFDKYDALPALKRSARQTATQQTTDVLKQNEGRKLEVLWLEDSNGELEPATLDSIDRNITEDYGLGDGVWYDGIVEAVTKSTAKVRFDEDGVTKQLNLFKQFEGSKRLSNYLEEGVAWKWAD